MKVAEQSTIHVTHRRQWFLGPNCFHLSHTHTQVFYQNNFIFVNRQRSIGITWIGRRFFCRLLAVKFTKFTEMFHQTNRTKQVSVTLILSSIIFVRKDKEILRIASFFCFARMRFTHNRSVSHIWTVVCYTRCLLNINLFVFPFEFVVNTYTTHSSLMSNN